MEYYIYLIISGFNEFLDQTNVVRNVVNRVETVDTSAQVMVKSVEKKRKPAKCKYINFLFVSLCICVFIVVLCFANVCDVLILLSGLVIVQGKKKYNLRIVLKENVRCVMQEILFLSNRCRNNEIFSI